MNTTISNPKGGEGILRIHIYFPIGTRPTLVQGGGRHVHEMPTPRSIYDGCVVSHMQVSSISHTPPNYAYY